MKKIVTAFALLFASTVYASPAVAQVYGPVDTDKQDRKEATKWEVAYQVLSVVDAAQTVDCLNRNVCIEANPLYGRNPSKGKVIGIKLATGVIHWLVFDHIADRNPKAAKIFSKVSFGVQFGVVAANLRFTF